MKKLVICVLILCSFITIQADDRYYFEIRGSQENVDKLYTIKKEFLQDFKEWAKGMDKEDYEEILKDHLLDYESAYYQDHTLIIVVDSPSNKVLKGEIKTNYCEENVKVKSLLFEWFSKGH